MDIAKIRGMYKVILSGNLPGNIDGTLQRVNNLRWLERELKTEFIDTQDFHSQLNAYLAHGKKEHKTLGRKIQDARKVKKWTQQDLANHLSVNRRTIIRFENNSQMPTKRIRAWLEKEEHQA